MRSKETSRNQLRSSKSNSILQGTSSKNSNNNVLMLPDTCNIHNTNVRNRHQKILYTNGNNKSCALTTEQFVTMLKYETTQHKSYLSIVPESISETPSNVRLISNRL